MNKIKILHLCLLISSFSSFSNNIEECWAYRDSAIREMDGTKSLYFSNKMLKIAHLLENDTLIAQSYIEIAHDYMRIGNYNSCIENAFNAANHYNRAYSKGLYQNMNGLIYDIIATAYYSSKNFEKAKYYYHKAINITQKTPSKNLLTGHYSGIGETFRLENSFDSSLFYFELADSIYKSIKSAKNKLALSNCNLGLAQLGLNNYEKADSLLQLAFDYYIPNKSYYAVCIAYFELAKKELERNNIIQAKSYVVDMLVMAKENNITDQLREGHLLMHDIAVLEQDYKTANKHLKQHYIFRDSLINNKVVSQMAEQRAEFEIDRKQDEVDHFKAISKARATIAYTLAIGLLLIIGLAIFLYQVNRKRRIANAQLKDKNQIIEHQLEEKEMLMREIHHRVKNNLQIISSIISLQNMRISDKDIQEIFTEMQRRITAISSIHQKLYRGESISQINMREYLGEVVESIHTAFKRNNVIVNYEILVQNVKLSVDSAVSIGLIVNELTTNAYKYAFIPKNQNQFLVSLTTNESGCMLKVSDNGAGIPEGKDILNSNSLGIRMVNLLSRQMKGQLSFNSDNGAEFSIFFEGMKAL